MPSATTGSWSPACTAQVRTRPGTGRSWPPRTARDGVLCLPPTMYRANRGEVLHHYTEVAKAGLPVMVYNNPIDTKVDLTPDLLAEIAQIENVVAVKEFSGDVRRVLEIRERAPELAVVAGADDVALEALLMGATGWFAGFPNVFPAESARLFELATTGTACRGAGAVRAAGRGVPVGLADRVRAGDQVRHGLRRPVRRPVPPAARSAHRRSSWPPSSWT